MTDKKITAWYTANPITLDPGDIFPVTENTGTTPATGAAKVSQLMLNRYKIVVSIASNNITIALKHEDGTNPSTDRPLYFKIGNSLRACTAATSVTKNAGTQWFALGTPFAALEQDFFVYIIWNTGPATDIIDIGFARLPYLTLYSQASATTTNELYLAYGNATAPASTDELVVIGRISATLSASTSYNWSSTSASAPTAENTKQFPIYNTNPRTWIPSPTGYSTPPTGIYNYMIDRKVCFVSYADTANGVSNATTKTATLPVTAATVAGMTWNFTFRGFDNGAQLTTPALAQITTASQTLSMFKDMSGAAWTASGNHRIPGGTFWYPIAN